MGASNRIGFPLICSGIFHPDSIEFPPGIEVSCSSTGSIPCITGSCKMLVKSGGLLSCIVLLAAASFDRISFSSVTKSVCLVLVSVSFVPAWSGVDTSWIIAGGRNPPET